MVLFGAGASFGSGDVDPRPPPLGKNLFGELDRLTPVGSSMSARLKERFRGNFEAGMAAYFAEQQGDTAAFQRELAGYFAQFTPGATNAYCRLLRELEGREVLYSSLNYDLLFELATELVGITATYGARATGSAVPILKLHGSCNFWPIAPRFKVEGLRITRSTVADVEGPVQPLSREDTLAHARDHSLAPALALYAEGKAIRVCREFVRQQLTDWQRAIARAEAVFLVGVRVYPRDQHIWATLASTSAAVHYFGLGADEDEFNSWRTAAAPKRASYRESTFVDAIPVISAVVRNLA